LELNDINYIRMHKGLLLLFKLVKIDREEFTNTYTNNREQLSIE